MVFSRLSGQRRRLGSLIALLALLLVVPFTPALAASSTFSLDKTAYATATDTITVSYSTTQASSTNWIGLYRDGSGQPGAVPSVKWVDAPGASGSVTLSTSGLSPGGYLAYYLYNDGYTQLTGPMHFWVTDGTTITSSTALTPSLTLDKAVYAPGSTIAATYRTPAASSTNWIGIYRDSDPVDSSHYIAGEWKYAPNASGSVTLPTSGLSPGGYTAYYLYNNGYSTNMNGSYSDPVHFWVGSAPQGTVPQLDHVFVVMLENKAPGDIFGTTNNAPNPTSSSAPAPYLNQLALDNVALANSHGLHHPSDPNYIALVGGETYLKGNDFPARVGSINAPHLGTLVEGAGKTWKGYIEGMSAPCDLQKNGDYDPDNMPFLFFRDMTDINRCRNHLQPITQLWSDLQSTSATPGFVWFEPNSCNSMHNCSVATGDTWMRNNLPRILTSPAFQQQRSLLVITWDEDNAWTSANPIPTILVGSPNLTRTGFTSNVGYDHYSVTRTIEDGLGLPHTMTANDQRATPIGDVWR